MGKFIKRLRKNRNLAKAMRPEARNLRQRKKIPPNPRRSRNGKSRKNPKSRNLKKKRNSPKTISPRTKRRTKRKRKHGSFRKNALPVRRWRAADRWPNLRLS